ncbi:MAG: 4-hydroxybutyrate CoA-transferase, partial [SAR324 cluster bacterium]|nr:4-hydroxybutyrate CoA-transferase [SAR324 cluster bacterium]
LGAAVHKTGTDPGSRTRFGGNHKKIRLSDGQTYFMRPLHSSDERRLQEFFYSHNAETLMLRYRHQPKQMSR